MREEDYHSRAAVTSAAMTVRLNIDLGELPDEPMELASLAHLANVACGAHAGDEDSVRAVVRRAAACGAAVGAHPSYPDRANFGRAAMSLTDDALRATLRAQLEWLREIARSESVALTHVKPHGALYHACARDLPAAAALADVTRAVLGAVALLGPPAGALREVASSREMPYWREGFADRGYRDDGSLVPRGEPGALLNSRDAVRAQVRRLCAAGGVDTVCVHGDGADAVAVARAVREVLG